MFQNNHESALNQMSSGLYVFYDWHSKPRSPRSIGRSSKLDVQLEGIFGRLMLQTILFVDTQPAEWKFVASTFTPELPSIPCVFKSVEEARDCLNSCMCLYHKTLSSQFHSLEERDVPSGAASQLGTDPLAEWSRSFKSFMFEAGPRLSTRDWNAALLIEAQHITASILAVSGPSSQETIFDRFEEEFSQILALSSRLLTTQIPEPNFSSLPAFDMGILPQLYFVASRCRHPSIRRQALQILRQGPRQEGIWYREMPANIAERLMYLEEMDCEDPQRSEDIPANTRLPVINAKIDSARRIVNLHCSRQQLAEEGKTNVIHELVEY